jgi:hypothetical protein
MTSIRNNWSAGRLVPLTAAALASLIGLCLPGLSAGDDNETQFWQLPAATAAPAIATPTIGWLPSWGSWPGAPAVPATGGWAPQLSGWTEQGYTYANTGTGRLAVAPEMNRYGQTYLFNQVALTAERRADTEELSCGYYLQLFGGADAFTLQGPGDIRNSSPYFGASVRQARAQFHVPILCERGIDVVVGRQGSPMGYESYMAPLRPFYSLSYQWFYAEDGADTGCWTTFHVADGWDVLYGTTLGSNTLFTLRDHNPCQIAQVKHWWNSDRRAYWCATLIAGDQAVGKNFIAYPGRFATVLELRTQFDMGERWTQVLEANLGSDDETLVARVGRWAGVLGNTVYHCNSVWDTQARLEWFDDANGVRTGVATNYFAATGGAVAHLSPRLMLRPELRGDFAGDRVFGPVDSLRRERSQLTASVDCVLTF